MESRQLQPIKHLEYQGGKGRGTHTGTHTDPYQEPYQREATPRCIMSLLMKDVVQFPHMNIPTLSQCLRCTSHHTHITARPHPPQATPLLQAVAFSCSAAHMYTYVCSTGAQTSSCWASVQLNGTTATDTALWHGAGVRQCIELAAMILFALCTCLLGHGCVCSDGHGCRWQPGSQAAQTELELKPSLGTEYSLEREATSLPPSLPSGNLFHYCCFTSSSTFKEKGLPFLSQHILNTALLPTSKPTTCLAFSFPSHS